MDVFWYPVKQKGTLWEHYKDIFKHKSKLFSIILEE
jgi:hypothetical protein